LYSPFPAAAAAAFSAAAVAGQIAVDFVSPENMATCLAQREKLRSLDLALGEPTLKGEVSKQQ
jgi:hypothetical protein